MQKQPNSSFCFVCGLENVAGVKVRFYETIAPTASPKSWPAFLVNRAIRATRGACTAVSSPASSTRRSPVQSTTEQVWTWRDGGITAELNTRFLQPVPLEVEISARGRVLSHNRSMFTGSGEICLPDGTVAVRAEGKFLKLPLSAISGAEVELPGWRLYEDEE